MNLCFLTQEESKVPSGVVTVLTRMTKKWNQSDDIIILTNRRHWANLFFEESFCNNSNVSIKRFSWFLPHEFLSSFRSQSLSLRVMIKLFKIVLSPLYILNFVFWIKKNNIEGLLSHNGGWPAGDLNRWAIFAGKLAGLKYNILVIHNLPAQTKFLSKIITDFRDKIISWCSSEIITVSHACREGLIEGSNLDKRIKVVYNGIDPRLPYSTDQAPNWVNDSTIIGFVGELHQRKGVHILLKALQLIKNPCDVVLIGNGDPSYVNELKTLESKSPWRVHFLGFRNDVISLYKWLDIIVLPSIEFESFGMVLLEAMLWKKPTICSNFSGMKEVVSNGKTGFVVPANDYKSLAISLDKLLKSKQLRRNMGREGRNRLIKNFSDTSMVKNYESLFK